MDNLSGVSVELKRKDGFIPKETPLGQRNFYCLNTFLSSTDNFPTGKTLGIRFCYDCSTNAGVHVYSIGALNMQYVLPFVIILSPV